jgi:hypothetical protein
MSTDTTEVQLPDPPHGGRFVRHEDGSLECTHATKPQKSISEAAAAPADGAQDGAGGGFEAPKE